MRHLLWKVGILLLRVLGIRFDARNVVMGAMKDVVPGVPMARMLGH